MSYLTIPGFEKLSKQEMFDMSLAHIRKTGVKSVGERFCTYSGTGCAAAPFLRDEGKEQCDKIGSWDTLSRPQTQGTISSPARSQLVPDHEVWFIKAMQICHDGTHETRDFLPQFENSMKELAKREGLIYTPAT